MNAKLWDTNTGLLYEIGTSPEFILSKEVPSKLVRKINQIVENVDLKKKELLKEKAEEEKKVRDFFKKFPIGSRITFEKKWEGSWFYNCGTVVGHNRKTLELLVIKDIVINSKNWKDKKNRGLPESTKPGKRTIHVSMDRVIKKYKNSEKSFTQSQLWIPEKKAEHRPKDKMRDFKVILHITYESYSGYDHDTTDEEYVSAMNKESAEKKALALAHKHCGELRRGSCRRTEVIELTNLIVG